MVLTKDIKFRIFVESDMVYFGDFSEFPQEQKERMVEALDEWGEVLGKSGLREMIFSLLAFYDQRQYECIKCRENSNENAVCPVCGEKMSFQSKYAKNEKISALLNCIGMITHLEIER